MLTNILNSQPQGHPQINWGNPLARGLVAVVIDGVFNPVNDRPYTLGAGFSGAMSRAYSPQGVALSVDGPSTPTATITLQTSGLDTRSFSVAGKIRTRAVGGAGVGARAGTGNIVLWRNSGWDCRIGGTDYTAGGTYNLNEVYDYALTSSASAVGLYVNGQSVIAGGVGGAGTLSDMQMFVDGAGGGSHFLDVWWFGVWNRPLTALEVQELRVNPWQIFDSAPSIPLIGISGGGTTINCALGTASASDYQATVSQATAISCALGTASAQGYQAQIAQGTDIVCARGTATASGYAAQVSQGTSIACSMGTATATGYQAAISSGGVVACSLGTASAIGYQATVSAATVISCSVGTATASGYQAQISQGTVINCSLAQAAAAGFLAAISQGTTIACSRGTASAIGYLASVSSTAAALVASPDYIGRHTARNFSTARHRTRNFSTAT